MIIAIDFDGTIVADKYPEIGELMPGASAVIKLLKTKGHYIIINTCRTGDHLAAALNFLHENGISYNRVNDNHPDLTRQFGVTRKVFADVYIDDRNLGGFPGWDVVFKKFL